MSAGREENKLLRGPIFFQELKFIFVDIGDFEKLTSNMEDRK